MARRRAGGRERAARAPARGSRRILARQPKTLPITAGRTPVLLEKRPAFAKKLLAGRDYRVGVTLTYWDERAGRQVTEDRSAVFHVGRGNLLPDLRDLKGKLRTWTAVAKVLGIGERHLRKLRKGSDQGRMKRPGAKVLGKIERTQKRLGLRPHGRAPQREFMSKAARWIYRWLRELYQSGAAAPGAGHWINFVDMLGGKGA